ncbi:mechanosensitive ion channel family protein [Corynebacterium pilosum]|uniref:Putative mechanosensitive ion channel protein n=1 Tax=Corynebacterium pilosum TaxID=35756 RepID=A0A376CK49_9CORY|nr:mechanosensitive ion channel family protein [Corynebacterium pilosum]STC68683.1 putative mechanosensitive ion channel protein [Corynebacterium pilosum]
MNTYLAQEESTSVPTSVDDAVGSVNEWWNNPVTQEWVIERPLKIVVILVVAAIIHWILVRVINRAARHNINSGGSNFPIFFRSNSDEQNAQQEAQEERRKQRVKTLASVGRSAVAIIVWVWAALAVLDQLGVNIGPLIASAGVVGVAIGFGAQSLVKDFLSGIFMLLEDQYGVGDTIEVNGISGDVEEVTLRITTVRDIDGTLWYVRNGEILQVGNFSASYSVARVQIPVSLKADPDAVADTIITSAERALEGDEWKSSVLEQPVLNGVTDFAVDHMSYRVSVKTLPGQQWSVQRHLNRRILDDLQSAEVPLPYPNGRFQFPGSEEE